ncbi:MAG: ABC transporter permease, partial [Gemmatimonadaceae bacterium]
MKRLRTAVLTTLHRRPAWRTLVLLLPAGGWLAIFFAAPLGIMATYAFRPRYILGGVYPGWTTTHVTRLAEPLYLGILVRSILLSLAATVLSLLVAYPMALVIARAARWRAMLLF